MCKKSNEQNCTKGTINVKRPLKVVVDFAIHKACGFLSSICASMIACVVETKGRMNVIMNLRTSSEKKRI